MPWEYAQEKKMVEIFFKDHADHPAVKAAETFIAQWLKAVAMKDAPAGNAVFARLHHCCIEPRAILTEIMATWLYSSRNEHALPDDQRLTMALARNAARLAGWNRKQYGKESASVRPKSADVRLAGDRIRAVLASFYINMKQSLDATVMHQQGLKADLSKPF